MNWLITLGILVAVLGIINLLRMGIFLVGSDIYSLKQHLSKKKKPTNSILPTISVVIPAHNEEDTILHCISSVVQADYPKKLLQIIVANDGCQGRSSNVLRLRFSD
jgi:cellulose synthase/poly-beta-1,6-N-acetylglucosamine synthase-like glycosyltransferase